MPLPVSSRRRLLAKATIAAGIALNVPHDADVNAARRRKKPAPIAAFTAQYLETHVEPTSPNGPRIVVVYRLNGLDMRVSPPVQKSIDWGIALSPTQMGTDAGLNLLRREVTLLILGRPLSQANRVYIEFV